MVGCKKDSLPDPTPIQTHKDTTKPAAPATLIIKADTALYNGVSTVRITTDGQVLTVGGQPVLNGTLILSNLTKDTVIHVVAINSNENGSTTKSTDFLVKVFSKKGTDWHYLNTTHNTLTRSCPAGTENSANPAWTPGPIDCNLYWIHANGTSTGSIGSCNPNPGTPTSGWWSWTDASEEYAMFSGLVTETYKITILPNGWKRSKIIGGTYLEQFFMQ